MEPCRVRNVPDTRVACQTRVVCIFKNLPCVHLSCPFQCCHIHAKVLNIGYRNRIGWGFSYRISDIGGDIEGTRAYRAFIFDTIYNEILIIKS